MIQSDEAMLNLASSPHCVEAGLQTLGVIAKIALVPQAMLRVKPAFSEAFNLQGSWGCKLQGGGRLSLCQQSP